MTRLLILTLAFPLAACFHDDGRSGRRFSDSFESQRQETADASERFRDMRHRTFESDRLHRESMRLLQKLDEKAAAFRVAIDDIRDSYETASAGQVRRDAERVETLLNEALAILSDMGKLISKDVIERVSDNVDTTIAEEDRAQVQTLYERRAEQLANLAGLRNVFVGSYNDLRVDLNARLHQLREEPIDEPDQALNPIVADDGSGGRISGSVVDSVSGQPLAGASVGFSTEPQSRNFFHETTTDTQGRYQSPPLRPGEYFIEIDHESYVRSRAERVQVSAGRTSNENVSATRPIGDAKFRVTITWCDPDTAPDKCQGAVQDVDSHLLIPGTAVPLAYPDRGKNYAGAHLDRDETGWRGPETVTIHDLRRGEYVYYVNNYNFRQGAGSERALGKSSVRVQVFKGGSNEVFKTLRVPPGSGLTYELFRIKDGTLRVTGRYTSSLPVR